MSRIVVLIGSNRRNGNTELLAKAFAEGASKNNIVELVSAADYTVNPCIGCNTCFLREGNKCFQNDDMPKIYEKLRNADGFKSSFLGGWEKIRGMHEIHN